jgi:hypothetical protein
MNSNKSLMIERETQTEVKGDYDDHGAVIEGIQTTHELQVLGAEARKASNRNITAMSNGLDMLPNIKGATNHWRRKQAMRGINCI